MSSNNNNSSVSVYTAEVTNAVVGYAELILSLIGIPCNIAVITLGFRICRKERQFNQILVVSMACADLIINVFHSPMSYGMMVFGANYKGICCKVFFFMTYLSCIASSISLLWLNIDKFLHVQKPVHYYIIATNGRLLGSVVSCWVISIASSFAYLFGPGASFKADKCAVEVDNLTPYYVFTTVFFVLPSLISLLLTIRIITIVRRSQKCRQLKIGNPTCRRSIPILSRYKKPDGIEQLASERVGSAGSQNEELFIAKTSCKKKAKWSVTRASLGFIFTTTLWSASTTIPYRIAYMCSYLEVVKKNWTVWSFVTMRSVFILLALNATGNPIITFFTNRKFRAALARKHLDTSFISSRQRTVLTTLSNAGTSARLNNIRAAESRAS